MTAVTGPTMAGPAVAPVLEARDLTRVFAARRHPLGRRSAVPAVRGVSISLHRGTVTAVVGESGSGKSTLARMLARIIAPTSGDLLLEGQPVPRGQRRRRQYAARVQLVLQDPFASLNPVHTVGYHLARPLRIHQRAEADLDASIADLLRRVSLEPAGQFTGKYPHELSGGQRQRVAIARALAAAPDVLLADEPVSMLDVSIRLGVLNLLADLRDRERLAILYVTHDIASARYLADSIAVMYGGQIVESAPAGRLTDSPAHPYTKLLLSAAPDPARNHDRAHDRARDRAESRAPGSGRPAWTGGRGVPGGPASSQSVSPSGCVFQARCPHVMALCRRQAPPPAAVAPAHFAACWLHTPVQANAGQEEVIDPPQE